MNLNAHIISTRGKRLRSIKVVTPSLGLDRVTISLAEQEARDWARTNGHKVISDIVSQGEYRAWVEPLPAGRLANLAQRAATNARIAAQVAA
jgi:hypothetical protein